MKKKKNNKIKITVLSLFIVIIFTLFYIFINDKDKNNILFNNMKDISADISGLISFSNNKKDFSKDLIKEINNDYKKEIDELKKILELNTLNSNKEFINATVIKRSTNYWYNLISIDKGSADGIKNGCLVINKDGLIGKIIKVNKKSSDIKLITSPNEENHLSVMFNYENKFYYGLIDKYDYQNNKLIIKNVIGDFNKEKIKDINVTTSGLNDAYTSGLLIGKIISINKDHFGISNEITIIPTVDFNNLDIVSVVVGDR